MDIDVVRPLELTPNDLAAWEGLRTGPALASPFFSPKWVQALAHTSGPDHAGGRVAIIREGGEAVGFLPARAGRFTALPIGSPLADYQGLIGRPGLKVDPRMLVRALGVARLDFEKMLMGQGAMDAFARGRSQSQIICLRDGYDAYAKGRLDAGSDILKDCAKKRRKLEREHGEVVFTAASKDRAAFDQLLAWKRQQYATTRQTDVFDARWPLELIDDLFAREDEDFRACLFTLTVGGKLIAAHLALCNRRVVHAWFIAHDNAYGKYSPGVVLIADLIRWTAEQGITEIDLGPGDYRFKLSLANATRDVGHGFVGRPSAAAFMRGAEYRLRDAAERLPLGAASALPGKAMRRLDLWRGLGVGAIPLAAAPLR